MPVPVPRQSKPLAHPVLKATQGQTYQSHNATGSLPVPPRGPPPSFGTREEWLSSLPSWRRNKQRLFSDEDGLPAQHHTQDFYLGLAAAGNATAIKGAHAEACIPPMHSLFQHYRAASDAVPARDQYGGLGGSDVEMSAGNGFTGLTIAHLEEPANIYVSYDGIDAMREDMPDGLNGKLSPIEDMTNSATLNDRCHHSGAFSPIFEDQSPGSASGPDSGSSPLEPLTPFGEFVDRAVADAQYAGLENHYVDRSVIQDYYRENGISDTNQAAPVFPSIADEPPKQQDPIPDTVTPSSSVSYKKLAEPLSEWVANYVWKVCTTGFSLPSAFAQPSMNAGPYTVTAPNYLAPSIHSLLLSTLLQPSAVLLAVWYIVRLPVYFAAAPLNPEFVKENAFRLALLDHNTGLDHDTAEASAAFRLVVLGCMLANKWLDDHTFSNKTWHSISNIPVQSLNKLESLALDIFTYDLSISSQQWSQWLSHVLSYHVSLSSPTFPQPISRPSSNPHSIVRRAIEEIIQAPSTCKSTSSIPRPIFLGLEDRLRERQEKEQALAMDVLEIDLDEDGPLREEYLPKRRASKLGSQSIQARHDNSLIQANEKWNLSEGLPIKTLPPPAKWSPAGDEPILRNRNRVSGHYVAVQAPPMTTGYPANRDVAYNQNWNSAAYMPIKSQTGYMYDMPPLFSVGQPNYNPFGYIASVPLPHSRSQSLSYDPDTLLSHNHMRSYSQTRFEYKCSDLRMTACEQAQIHESESRWMDATGHYPYPGPAYIHIPAVGMQPAW